MSHSGTVLSSLDRPMKAIVTAALIALLALAGCESGTQEPEAPTAEPVELGAAPTAGGEVEDSAAAPAPRGDGSIAPERFPAELPDRAEAAIPGNFPSSLPVYPNSTPALGMSGDVEAMMGHSDDYLRAFSIVTIAWCWMEMAIASKRRLQATTDDEVKAVNEGRLRLSIDTQWVICPDHKIRIFSCLQ